MGKAKLIEPAFEAYMLKDLASGLLNRVLKRYISIAGA